SSSWSRERRGRRLWKYPRAGRLGRRTFRIGGFKQQCSGATSACRFQVCRIGMSEPRRYDMPIVPPGARPYIRRPAGRGRRMARRECSLKAKELPMVEVIERETVNEAIEATVNYILDNGEKIFTQTTTPGSTDVRSGGTVDPHRVTIRNARLHAEPFALDREGFRFVRHDTKVADFFN